MIRKEDQYFYLENRNISYVIKVLESGHLGHIHFGSKIKIKDIDNIQVHLENSSLNSRVEGIDTPIMLNCRTLEYSISDNGDLRKPSVIITSPEYDTVWDFKFKDYDIFEGAHELTTLPSAHSKKEDSETLRIGLLANNIDLSIYYTIYKDSNIITKSCIVQNNSKYSINIEKIMSSTLDFISDEYKFDYFSGDWSREMNKKTYTVDYGTMEISSSAGSSSAYVNPFSIFRKSYTNEDYGECYGHNLVYSGNHCTEVSVNSYNLTRVNIGINPEGFSYKLNSGESFESPQAVIGFSKHGTNGLSHNLHKFINKHIIKDKYYKRDNLVTYNNWEATFFDFDEERILKLVDDAKKIGADLFVLDDGWFEGRNDDTTSLGDWVVDYSKLENGLDEIIEKVTKNNMKFGIWFEPEMINFESKLYKNHPEWVLRTQDENVHQSSGRGQYILDFTNELVIQNIYNQMCKILSENNISYIKWDMNRIFSQIGSPTISPDKKGMVAHKYIQGVYKLVDMIQNRFPNILIQGCASGGNRFDLGLLCYMPQNWVSDNTDPLRRLENQYNLSFGYPLSTMDNGMTKRLTGHYKKYSFETIFSVAAFGNFGYIYDISAESSDDIERLRNLSELYKDNYKKILWNEFYRLKNNRDITAMQSGDHNGIIVLIVAKDAQQNDKVHYVKFKNLEDDNIYIIDGKEFYGSYLMNIGYRFKTLEEAKEQYYSELLFVEKKVV